MNNNILTGLLLYFVTHIIIWLQVNGQFVWPWAKDNPWTMALLGFPISYVLIIATKFIVAGFDGSREVMDAIEAGDINHTVLQPIANFSEMAVRMAHDEVTTGNAPAVEKASIDCLLVNAGNVSKCGVFRCDF